jgi:excinuclease ABC subunit A
MNDYIYVKGAREHNLKNIDVKIPRNKLVVITGLSGSGKSSLAFDTIYAEGQRRYVESLSSYARQFLGQMDKPDVDYIEGLSPSISIDQKTTARNPRSTVGTVTEIYDYFRLLYARVGVPHCPICGDEIKSQTIDDMTDAVMELPENTKIYILAPVVRGRKGEYSKQLKEIERSGFVRVRVDGAMYETTEDIPLDKNKKHDIEVVVDRLIVKPGIRSRLSDSVETALRLSEGLMQLSVIDGEERIFSQNYSCLNCGVSIEELSPRMFSFNSPFGACPTCSGLGYLFEIDPDLLIPDRSKSLLEGAIRVAGYNLERNDAWGRSIIDGLANEYGIDLKTPVKDLPPEFLDLLMYGTKGKKYKIYYDKNNRKIEFETDFEGLVNTTMRRYKETTSEGMKRYYTSFMANKTCPSCEGARLKKEVLAVTFGSKNVYELTSMPVSETSRYLKSVKLTKTQELIADRVLKEISERIGFLNDVGLGYLTLARSAGTLSGGEAQRIRLATQIGSGLTGVLYILDEPSIGLHQKDNAKLIATLKKLRDLGNTIIVIEHDLETMYESDYIIDIGPGAGVHGGEVIVAGTVEDVKACQGSVTGQYMSGRRTIEIPGTRRKSGRFLSIKGASENNLKHIDVDIPIGTITCITGVSGSGKSSLINEILYKQLACSLNRANMKPGKHDAIYGLEYLDKVIDIDQSPIGRTPRSNPATYTAVFDQVRDLFAMTKDAKVKGYSKGRFSFNVKGGRCEACSGDGIIKIEMHFLPDVYVPCSVCKGKRYNKETLTVKYKGKSITEVLDMTVEEAMVFFENIPGIYSKLCTINEVGLGYIKLGQSSTTLSGGEAQRVKLATELSKRMTGKTIYILDEPTTGLHMADVHKLVSILQRLCDAGNTVVVIEHNLDVVKTSDYIIDLGPEGGDAGGMVIAKGTPEELVCIDESFTGRYLRKEMSVN